LARAESLGLVDAVAMGRAFTIDDVIALADALSIFSGIIVTMLDPIYTGHIANGRNGSNGYGERGEISDTVGGVVEEEVMV
jgi:hypothetical protein